MANGKLEALLAEWRQKRLLILGLGVSNRPLARLLLEAGCRVTGCDRTDRERQTYDNEDAVRQMVSWQKDMKIPTGLIPRCPVCGAPMTMNLRCDGTFVRIAV